MSDKNDKVKYNLKNAHYALLTIGIVNDICLWRAGTMSIRDGGRFPHRRILTGSDFDDYG